MPLRFTMGFRVGKYSWTEAHDLTMSAAVNSVAAIQAAQGIGAARVAILSAPASILYIRISSIPANRFVFDYYPPFSSLFGAQSFGGAPVSTVKGTNAQVPGLGLLVRMYGSDEATTQLYLTGLPSGIYIEPGYQGQGYDFSQVAGFQQLLGNYLNYLISNNFGWYTRRNGPTQYQAAGPLVTNAAYPGSVGVTLASSTLNVVPPGTALLVKGWRRLSTRSPGLSGVFRTLGQTLQGTAGGVTTFTYFLANTGNVQPSNFFTIGSIGASDPNFTNYIQYEVIGATTRKRGARFGAPRGRSSIRA